MTTTPPILPHYQALERTGTLMAAAARQGNWAEVERLEAVAQLQVRSLKATGAANTETLAQRRSRLAALKAVLRLDAQVRNLAEPGWLLVERWITPAHDRRLAPKCNDTENGH